MITDIAQMSICQDTPRGGGRVCQAVQGPAWGGAGDFVAYLDSSPERSLVVTDLDNRNPKQIDTGVDSFAWAPPSR